MSNPMMNAPPRERQPDCLSCRLTGAAAFTGLGAYAIYEANRQGTFKRTRPAGSPFMAGKIQAVIGFVFISLGIGRLIMPTPAPAPTKSRHSISYDRQARQQ